MKIEGKSLPIIIEHERDENEPLVGIIINRNGDIYEASSGDFVISEALQVVLKQNDRQDIVQIITNEEGEEVEEIIPGEEALYYIWTQEDLNNMGLENITINEIEFYIIDYRTQRIFHSVGYNGIFELSKLKEIEL
jgi:hypothetical protein